jgi:hypothetical protein
MSLPQPPLDKKKLARVLALKRLQGKTVPMTLEN